MWRCIHTASPDGRRAHRRPGQSLKASRMQGTYCVGRGNGTTDPSHSARGTVRMENPWQRQLSAGSISCVPGPVLGPLRGPKHVNPSSNPKRSLSLEESTCPRSCSEYLVDLGFVPVVPVQVCACTFPWGPLCH